MACPTCLMQVAKLQVDENLNLLTLLLIHCSISNEGNISNIKNRPNYPTLPLVIEPIYIEVYERDKIFHIIMLICLVAAEFCGVGMKNGKIPDVNITASSTWDTGEGSHFPSQARLDYAELSGSWTAENSEYSHFKVNLVQENLIKNFQDFFDYVTIRKFLTSRAT